MTNEQNNYKQVKKIIRRRLFKAVFASVKNWTLIALTVPIWALITGIVAKACYYAFMFGFNLF